MTKKLKVFKVGGGIIEEPNTLNIFLESFARIKEDKILIHGGGKGANKLLKKMGVEPLMIDGRRVTDEKTLQVVTMFYAGFISKNIVALLQKLKVNAMGMSGVDGNSIQSSKRSPNPINYGFVGDVTSNGINKKLVKLLLENKLTPVFCAITHDGTGQLLNTNADTIAAQLAIAMSKHYHVELHYCFDKKGVLKDINDGESVIQKITKKKYEKLRQEGIISDGMIPKLDNAFKVIESGVEKVILEHALYIDEPLKTTICK